MTENQQSGTCEQKIIADLQPFSTADKKKRIKLTRMDYNWSNTGGSGVSQQIRVQVANLDTDGDPSKKAEIGIPLELVEKVSQGILTLSKQK